MPKRFITTEFYQELDAVISKMKYFFIKFTFSIKVTMIAIHMITDHMMV